MSGVWHILNSNYLFTNSILRYSFSSELEIHLSLCSREFPFMNYDNGLSFCSWEIICRVECLAYYNLFSHGLFLGNIIVLLLLWLKYFLFFFLKIFSSFFVYFLHWITMKIFMAIVRIFLDTKHTCYSFPPHKMCANRIFFYKKKHIQISRNVYKYYLFSLVPNL